MDIEFRTTNDRRIPDNPVVANGRYQCWGCKHREGRTIGGIPICSVDGGLIMIFVYEPCHRFEVTSDVDKH